MESSPGRIARRIAVDEKGCWLWLGALNSKGYGSVGVNGKALSTHRNVYEQLAAPIPEGHQIHHRCGVQRCCNPDHLEAITGREHRRHHFSPGAPCGRGHTRRLNETVVGTARHVIRTVNVSGPGGGGAG